MTTDAHAFGVSRSRLLEELRSLEAYPGVRLLNPDVGAPIFEVTVPVAGREHHLRMVLPPAYPRVPPEVRETDQPGGVVVRPGAGRWRLTDGQLCLFTHGSDPSAWHPGRSLADAIVQAISLLAREEEARTVGGWQTSSQERLYVSPSVLQTVGLEESYGDLVISPIGEHGRECFVTEVRCRFPQMSYPVTMEAGWSSTLTRVAEVPWVRLPSGAPSWDELLMSPSTLRDGLERALTGERLEHVRTADLFVLARGDHEEAKAVLVHRPPTSLDIVQVSPVSLGDPNSLLFNRVDEVVPDRTGLSAVPVVIIGAGSLGGAISLALARAGVSSFLLIDHDLLMLDNVARHVGTVADVGRPKVEVVAAAVRGVNPAAWAECMQKPLAWDMPAYGAGLDFERWLGRHADAIVVSTCAFGPVERQLNEVLVQRRVPAVYASVLGPGHHGRVHRVIPGQTPCYECVLTAQNREPQRFPRYAVDGVEQESRVPYLQPSLPGLAIDIGQVALAAARLVLQTIGRTKGIDLGLGDEVGDHLLWTNRGGWAFDDRPLQIRIERPTRDEQCAVCGSRAEPGVLSEADEAELVDLLGQVRRPRDGDSG